VVLARSTPGPQWRLPRWDAKRLEREAAAPLVLSPLPTIALNCRRTTGAPHDLHGPRADARNRGSERRAIALDAPDKGHFLPKVFLQFRVRSSTGATT
jgi:hypothetical protein